MRLPRALAETELDVLAEFLKLILEPALRVFQLLDAAGRLPQLLLEPVDAQDLLGRFGGVVSASAWNVSRRRRLRRLRRLPVEKVELGVRSRRDGGASDYRCGQTQGSKRDHGAAVSAGSKRGAIPPADGGFKPRRSRLNSRGRH